MLPSVAQCHEFLAALNSFREDYGLPILTKLNFDECEPQMPDNCLSARHLTAPLGGETGSYNFETGGDYPLLIPHSILRVTDPFDLEEPGLGARMAEAGIIYT